MKNRIMCLFYSLVACAARRIEKRAERAHYKATRKAADLNLAIINQRPRSRTLYS